MSSTIQAITAHKVVRKTAAQSVISSTTLVSDTHFLFTIGASEVWAFDIYAPITMGVTGQIKIAITNPVGATLELNGLLAGAGTAAYGNTQTTATGVALSTILTSGMLHVHGTVVNSTTAGTVQFQWAQAASEAVNTTLLINSVMIAHRIA